MSEDTAALRTALEHSTAMAHAASHVGRSVPHGVEWMDCKHYPCLGANAALATSQADDPSGPQRRRWHTEYTSTGNDTWECQPVAAALRESPDGE